MGLIRWNPWQELESINRQLTHMLDDSSEEGLIERGKWLPAVDIHETDDMFTVEADLPGIDKKDVKVDVEGGMLVISGERHYEKDEKNENMHRIERSYGRFSRSFSLPSYVDTSKVKARMENGVLKVELPKQEAIKPKNVEIE